MIRRTTLAVGICLALHGGVALAHDVALEGPIVIPETADDAYVNVDGMAVRTGGGECLRLGGFSEDDQVDACEGIEPVAEIEPEPEPEPAPPPEPEPVAKVELREVDERALFAFDSAELTGDGEAAMDDLFSQLEEFQGVTAVSVIGHTDSTGPEEYNLSLSEQRAATVAALLQERYPDATVEVEGRGESDPIATNETAEGRQSNRRVEIEVTASRMTFE